MFLHLPAIIKSKRREEVEFWRRFTELRPRILGGLLDAVALAPRELPSVQLAELPRMADFARFGEAVGRGLGWPRETFLAAYLDNRQQATLSTLEDSILANTLLKMMEMCSGLVEWEMPASEMLAKLTLNLDRRIAKSPAMAQDTHHVIERATTAGPTSAVRAGNGLKHRVQSFFQSLCFRVSLPGFYWTYDLCRYPERLVQDPVVLARELPLRRIRRTPSWSVGRTIVAIS